VGWAGPATLVDRRRRAVVKTNPRQAISSPRKRAKY